jgi:hypothetical protein
MYGVRVFNDHHIFYHTAVISQGPKIQPYDVRMVEGFNRRKMSPTIVLASKNINLS